jgi:hypothetical protein
MIDRRTIMWNFIQTILNTPTDLTGTIFIACSNQTEAKKMLSDDREEAHGKGQPIINGTIRFGKTLFSRCDKFLLHSGESRNSIYDNSITGKSAPFLTALMSETINLIENTSSEHPLYILILSLKKDSASKNELFVANQTWFAECISAEVISLYSTNMLKYGIMTECNWINHKINKDTASAEEKVGNYEVQYGISDANSIK